MSNVEIKIATEYSGKGMTQAEKAAQKLARTVTKLAGALGLSLGTAAVARFGKASVKAFLDDEAAATRLTNTMKNLGLELSAPSMQRFIENLATATGVVDDKLRPAMQALLQVTGSVNQSQKILATSIDISRATGADLTQVANDLAQAFVGNTKGLRKYNLGLTQAELKAASFADIMARVNTLFGGASQAHLATYSGQMELLSQRAGEAQEIIGKGLIDSLIMLADTKDGVQGVADAMANAAQNTADFSLGVSTLFTKVKGTKIGEAIFGTLGDVIKYGPLGDITRLGTKTRKTSENKGAVSGQISSALAAKAKDDAAKAEKLAAKRAKDIANAQNKVLKAQKDSLKVKQIGAVFDLQQIQIAAALKGKISEEERTRLELQSALLAGNVDEADRLVKKLAETTGMTTELKAWLLALPEAKNPFEAWKSYLDSIEEQVKRIAMQNNVTAGYGDYSGSITNQSPNTQFPSFGMQSGGDTYIDVTVEGSVSTESDLIETIRLGLINGTMSSKQAQIERNFGAFR